MVLEVTEIGIFVGLVALIGEVCSFLGCPLFFFFFFLGIARERLLGPGSDAGQLYIEPLNLFC